MTGPVLWSTDVFAARVAERMASVDPTLGYLELRNREFPAASALERVTYACLSSDSFPERFGLVIRGCREAPNLRWLHTFSAGVDRPVFHELMDRGVIVTTSSGSAASPIAQTVMMYLLALSRDLPRWFRAQQEHRWEQRRIDELEGLSIGVVGMGPIGLEVVRLAEAFGMSVVAMRREVRGNEPCETWSIDRLPELARSVDALVLAIPLTDQTAGLIDAEVISAMKPGALFVNVGRGGLVDENALASALRSGRLGGAGLDVFTTEPLPPDSPFWELDNVIVTPHSSGFSLRSDERATDLFVDNFSRMLDGLPLLNRA